MKIYKYIADSDEFNSFITVKEHREIYSSIGKGSSLVHSWKPMPVKNFFKDKEGVFMNRIGDFPSLVIGDPVFSEKAWGVFKPYIGKYTEPLPLITTEGKYYALNILNIIDALDKENSEISYRSRDRKSTRLNSSHVRISYAGFCLKERKVHIKR